MSYTKPVLSIVSDEPDYIITCDGQCRGQN